MSPNLSSDWFVLIRGAVRTLIPGCLAGIQSWECAVLDSVTWLQLLFTRLKHIKLMSVPEVGLFQGLFSFAF